MDEEMLFGPSATNARVLDDVRAFAATPFPVLILGPTGSGKSSLAAQIHRRSTRRGGPFIAFPLTAVPDELRHAEVSGYRRGAFTGATEDRAGLIEAASGGTLFLDELGHASMRLQQLLLGVLENGKVRRLGEVKERPADARFIFATSADLQELCDAGRFLPELFFRVECLTIRMPSLAERRGDVPLLTRAFLREALRELGKPYRTEVADDLLRCLMAAPWPGNVRQLKSVCRHLAARLDGDRAVELTDLPRELRESWKRDGGMPDPVGAALSVLRRVDGNKAKAARILGVSRSALYRMLASQHDPSAPDAV